MNGVNSNGKDERMKRKLWVKIMAVLVAVIMLMAGSVNISAASGITVRKGIVYQNNKVYTGWFVQKNSRYYSVKGVKAKGWKKISNKYYYFTFFRNAKYFTANCKKIIMYITTSTINTGIQPRSLWSVADI